MLSDTCLFDKITSCGSPHGSYSNLHTPLRGELNNPVFRNIHHLERNIHFFFKFIKSIPLIQLIGRETLFIYGFHYPVVALARFIVRRVSATQNLIVSTLISLLVANIIIVFLILIKIICRRKISPI